MWSDDRFFSSLSNRSILAIFGASCAFTLPCVDLEIPLSYQVLVYDLRNRLDRLRIADLFSFSLSLSRSFLSFRFAVYRRLPLSYYRIIDLQSVVIRWFRYYATNIIGVV